VIGQVAPLDFLSSAGSAIGSGQASGLAGYGWMALLWGLGLIFVIGSWFIILYFVIKHVLYNVRVEVFVQRGGKNLGSQKIMYDRGRIFDRNGVTVLHLRKAGKFIKPPPRDYLYIVNNKVDKVYYYRDVNDSYHPAKLWFDEVHKRIFLVPKVEDDRAWHVNEVKANRKAYDLRSTLEKYAPIFLMVFTLVCILIAIIYVSGRFEKFSETSLEVGRGLQAIAEAVKGL
jgi:hypothetical protein